MASEYSKTGVDAHKKGIEVFKTYTRNIFSGAFCVVTQDPEFPDRGIITHSDGAGSKTITNYLLAKEYGDNKYFEPVAQDVLAMNIDDIDCVNSKPLSFVDYVAINRFTVPKEEFLSSLNNGFGKCFDLLRRFEIPLPFGGGETADLPDQVRTVDVSGTIVSRVKLNDAITGRKIEPGNYIVGIESGGKTNYESKENSGIMCNGLTLARHCLTHHSYEEKYPEIRDPKGKSYTGKFKLGQNLDDVGMTLGDALTSPTRIFSPINRKILDMHKKDITGVVHDTGGGATKILKLGKNVHYIKSNPPKPDPIFYLIQKESGESWRDMYQDFNCGIGMEYIVNSLDAAEDIQSIIESFGVGSRLLGNIRKSDGSNKLTIHTEFEKLDYP
jgi:phosphoribosylformylglycinamidine cyclo-ligase